MQHLSSCWVLTHFADDLCEALFHLPLKCSFCCMEKQTNKHKKAVCTYSTGIFESPREEQVKLQKKSKQGKFSSPQTFPVFPPCNKTAQKSALQASDLGRCYALLEIHVSNASEPSFLPQAPATPPSVPQKRTGTLRHPSRGKHNPKRSIQSVQL